jgi:hypothetical protein
MLKLKYLATMEIISYNYIVLGIILPCNLVRHHATKRHFMNLPQEGGQSWKAGE